jgi:hypothetical protein
MHDLVEAKAAYEEFLGKFSDSSESSLNSDWSIQANHASIIGKAIATCLASGDAELRTIAEGDNGLTPYFVDGFKSRNRDKLHEALNHLGKLIYEASYYD